jgi:GT2 family glycosyltransferase
VCEFGALHYNGPDVENRAIRGTNQEKRDFMLTASVIICAYADERWDDTIAAVASVESQQPSPHEVILVVDHNPELQARFVERLPQVRVSPNQNERGLSGARNTGIALTSGDIVAFLDDDAIALPGWLDALTRPYADPNVIGVGGRTEPGWATGRPRWWPGEFDWVVGCTYTGQEPGTVRNLLGGNASYRRDLFAVGAFASHIGRTASNRRPLGCEETEFCIRVNKDGHRGVFVYDDRPVIVHKVPAARQHFSYFRSRCLAEGMSKALVTESVGLGPSLATERRYSTVTLPAGVLRGLGRGVCGDLAALLSAAAIVVGLAYTVVGYGIGLTQVICRVPGAAR